VRHVYYIIKRCLHYESRREQDGVSSVPQDGAPAQKLEFVLANSSVMQRQTMLKYSIKTQNKKSDSQSVSQSVSQLPMQSGVEAHERVSGRAVRLSQTLDVCAGHEHIRVQQDYACSSRGRQRQRQR
jgi:hypothetical protein